MRADLGMVGIEISGTKMPATLASLKSIPLSPPDCLDEVSERLAKLPVPIVGQQVPQKKNVKPFYLLPYK